MSDEKLEYPASNYILDEIDGIDKEVVFKRIANITESYSDFVSKQLDGVTAPNAEIPMYVAMGYSVLNLIPFTIGMAGGDQGFIDVVREELENLLTEDFSICYKHGLDARKNLEK